MELFFNKYLNAVKRTDTIHYTGSVSAVKGLMIESRGPRSMIGEICNIRIGKNKTVMAEVIGLEGHIVKLMAYDSTEGIRSGARSLRPGTSFRFPSAESSSGALSTRRSVRTTERETSTRPSIIRLLRRRRIR